MTDLVYPLAIPWLLLLESLDENHPYSRRVSLLIWGLWGCFSEIGFVRFGIGQHLYFHHYPVIRHPWWMACSLVAAAVFIIVGIFYFIVITMEEEDEAAMAEEEYDAGFVRC